VPAAAAAADWLSTKDACERLGVTLRTLYRLIDEGQVPAYKLGRLIRLKAGEVDAFIDGARIQPGELKHLYPSDTSETEVTGT
jgi:excisionase family DNA binding protein